MLMYSSSDSTADSSSDVINVRWCIRVNSFRGLFECTELFCLLDGKTVRKSADLSSWEKELGNSALKRKGKNNKRVSSFLSGTFCLLNKLCTANFYYCYFTYSELYRYYMIKIILSKRIRKLEWIVLWVKSFIFTFTCFTLFSDE